jgi:arginine repressor
MARELKDKSSKFVELAEKRVSRTLNDLKLIRNLSNKNYYEYSDEQSKKIIRVLQQELDLLKKSFQNLNSKEKGFKL